MEGMEGNEGNGGYRVVVPAGSHKAKGAGLACHPGGINVLQLVCRLGHNQRSGKPGLVVQPIHFLDLDSCTDSQAQGQYRVGGRGQRPARRLSATAKSFQWMSEMRVAMAPSRPFL